VATEQAALSDDSAPLRLLAACLHTLAPNEDHVPLRPALAHLFALNPQLSGELLAPAEWDAHTGMPAFPWVERAIAEHGLATSSDPTALADRADRVRALDPALAERFAARAKLHVHLRREALLPTSRVTAVVREVRRHTLVTLTHDAVATGGLWVRTRVDLMAREGARDLGPLRLTAALEVQVDPGVAHVLNRHLHTPLPLLREQLLSVVPAAPVRLTRGTIGPFWQPGLALPLGVPAAAASGFTLHAVTETLAVDVKTSSQRDPLSGPLPARPEGYGWFRERRLAASPAAYDPLRTWLSAHPGLLIPVRIS